MAKRKAAGRLRGRETADENLRAPAEPGRPPRPATEPPGSEWSTRSDETATDPATGEPIRKPPPKATPRRG